MCANRISTFLRSRRDCWKASVSAKARTRSRTSSLRSRVILRAVAVVHFGFNEQLRAVALAGPVVNDVALIDIARAGQFRTTWANIDVALLIEDEVGTAEGAIGTCRLVPHRYVRCDVAIHQPFEQPDRAIEPCRPRAARGRRSKRRSTRSTMVWVTAISTARFARVPTASMMIPALLSIR